MEGNSVLYGSEHRSALVSVLPKAPCMTLSESFRLGSCRKEESRSSRQPGAVSTALVAVWPTSKRRQFYALGYLGPGRNAAEL